MDSSDTFWKLLRKCDCNDNIHTCNAPKHKCQCSYFNNLYCKSTVHMSQSDGKLKCCPKCEEKDFFVSIAGFFGETPTYYTGYICYKCNPI